MYNSSRILFQPFDCIKRLALYLQESLVLKVPFGFTALVLEFCKSLLLASEYVRYVA